MTNFVNHLTLTSDRIHSNSMELPFAAFFDCRRSRYSHRIYSEQPAFDPNLSYLKSNRLASLFSNSIRYENHLEDASVNRFSTANCRRFTIRPLLEALANFISSDSNPPPLDGIFLKSHENTIACSVDSKKTIAFTRYVLGYY